MGSVPVPAVGVAVTVMWAIAFVASEASPIAFGDPAVGCVTAICPPLSVVTVIVGAPGPMISSPSISRA